MTVNENVPKNILKICLVTVHIREETYNLNKYYIKIFIYYCSNNYFVAKVTKKTTKNL